MDENLKNFLISFFGGGLFSALIVQLFALRSASRERKRSFLSEQIRELYGPMFYLVSQSEKLFDLNKKFHQAYRVEFIDTKYSQDDLTQERIDEDSSKTLELANKYVRFAKDNNEKIGDLLNAKFAYIDPDDTEVFLLFFEHRIRLETEIDQDGKLSTPLGVYDHLGEISYLRPEFIQRAKSQFLNKKAILAKLIN